MPQNNIYQFSPERRRALETLPHALAAYQYVGGSVRTLLVSEGMCRMTWRSREQLTRGLDEDMFANVHPDDKEMLANLGYEFIVKECAYDVVYRTRLFGHDEYRILHVVGRYQSMEDSTRVAFFVYHDITDTPEHQLRALAGTESPKSRFFDEHLGAMAIVSQTDYRLLYYNKALTRLLPPQCAYDSGITFNRFFFGHDSIPIDGLDHAVDAGPRLTTDPLTQRKIEINVLSSSYGEEDAYVIYFYEQQPDADPECAQAVTRHKRASFNTAIFTGESNELSFHDGAYKGFRVWNLTQNISVYQAGCTALFPAAGGDATLERYLEQICSLCPETEQCSFFSELSREKLFLLFESGSYPRQITLPLGTPGGTEYLSFRSTMMCSPDSGDLFLKIDEANVTESTIIDMLVTKTVEQAYDYVAYSDLSANRCHIISGKVSASGKKSFCIKTSDFIYCPSDIRTLPSLFPAHVRTLKQMHQYLISVCDANGRFNTLQELPGGVIKALYFELIDKERMTFYIRCKDVTQLLRTERERKEDLERAVLDERARAERLQLQTVLSISNALDARDPMTCSHSQRVAHYSAEIAKRLGWPQERVQNLYHIALVHDIGKIGVSDAVLQKRGTLTPDEYRQIQTHVDIGGFILKDFSAIDKVSEGALYHHERYDGKGYSRGLAGEEIPIEARIMCIADAIDAMNSTRLYRARQSEEYIRAELHRERGMQFDPMLADVLLTMIDQGLLTQA
jgi:response regulator RpfG family c-di-GMP phosphodiesterase